MAITCSTKGTVNIYYFFTHFHLFGYNNLTGTLHGFGNDNGEAKPLGTRQKRLLQRDSSQPHGRGRASRATDPKTPGKPGLRMPPRAASTPPAAPILPVANAVGSTWRRFFTRPQPSLFLSTSAPNTHTQAQVLSRIFQPCSRIHRMQDLLTF